MTSPRPIDAMSILDSIDRSDPTVLLDPVDGHCEEDDFELDPVGRSLADSPLRGLEFVVITFAVSVLPLQWLRVGVEPFPGVTLPDIAIALLGITAFVMGLENRFRLHRRLDGRAIMLFLLFLAAVTANAVTFISAQDPSIGRSLLLRDITCVSLAAMLYVALSPYDCRQVFRCFTIGFALSAILFAACVTYVTHQRGKSVLGIYGHAISAGDPAYVQSALYKQLFTEPGASSDSESPKGRHTSFLLFCLGAVTSWICLQPLWSGRRKLWIYRLLTLAFCLLVLSSLSRQCAIVLLVLTGCIAVGLRSGLAKLAIAGGLIVSAIAFVLSDATEILRRKFYDDVISNPRILQFSQTMKEVRENPWLGNGVGTMVSDDFYPHNLILHGWHQSGIIGLLSSSVCILYFVYCLGIHMRQILSREEQSSTASIAAVTIGSIVLVRLMVGVRGSLEIASILSMTLFMLIDRDECRRLQQEHDQEAIDEQPSSVAFPDSGDAAHRLIP